MPKKKIPKNQLVSVFGEFSPMRIKYKDVFDMKSFYETLYEMLQEYGYTDEEDNLEHWESYYGERIGRTGAREIWIEWRMRKLAPPTPYMTYYLDFTFHILGLTPIEIVKDGMKIKTNKGEVELFIRPYIYLDYMKRFAEHPILRHIEPLFTKRVYRKVLEQRKKELYQEVYAMNNFIKQWFKLKRYLPYRETRNFFPGV